MNTVKYNLKNVHYAKMTGMTDGVPTYATPIAIPGAVSLSLDQQGEVTKFYADGIVYWQSASNNGYEGDLEIALIPDSFLKEILGQVEDVADKVLIESADDSGSAYALLFEFEGDDKAIRHVLYNCTSTRPNLEGETTEDSKEAKPDTLTISAVPLSNNKVKARTTANTPATVFNGWYGSVWLPSGAAAYDLAVSETACTIVVTKNGTVINEGTDVLVTGDVITVTATADEGKSMSALTLNGADFTSGSTHTVAGDVTIVGAAS